MGARASSGYFLVCFSTAQFDLALEPENDINPIPGRSFLVWLRPLLERAGYTVDEPGTEDWGWYIVVEDADGDRFVVGASAQQFDRDEVEWTVRVHRWRTLFQWIRREPVLTRDAPLLRFIEDALAAPAFHEVDVTELTCAGFFESFRDWSA